MHLDRQFVFSREIQWPLPVRFRCTRCGKCCGENNHIYLILEDLRNIASKLGISKKEFLQKCCRKVIRRFTIGDTNYKIPSILLKKTKNMSCIFLRSGFCRVHKFKPFICRMYPFLQSKLFQKKFWQKVGLNCPGFGKGKKYDLKAIKRMISLEDKTLGDFLDMIEKKKTEDVLLLKNMECKEVWDYIIDEE